MLLLIWKLFSTIFCCINIYIHKCVYAYTSTWGCPACSAGKESTFYAGDPFDSWVGKILWRRDRLPTPVFLGFPGGSDGKESACNTGNLGLIPRLDPWVGKIPWRRAWQPTQVFLPGEFPWTEEPGGLQSMRLQRVGHD